MAAIVVADTAHFGPKCWRLQTEPLARPNGSFPNLSAETGHAEVGPELAIHLATQLSPRISSVRRSIEPNHLSTAAPKIGPPPAREKRVSEDLIYYTASYLLHPACAIA